MFDGKESSEEFTIEGGMTGFCRGKRVGEKSQPTSESEASVAKG